MNTIVIAQILGIFLTAIGIAMIFNSKGVKAAIEASVENKGILFLWGVLALLIGASIIAFNNVWASSMPLLVTVLGWLALIKGVFILIFPHTASSFYKQFNKRDMLVFVGVVVFIIGLVLWYL